METKTLFEKEAQLLATVTSSLVDLKINLHDSFVETESDAIGTQ